ncbi:MAG TPA: cation:proton antiporter [Desulfobacterales bacterium]|nr:cation:proton antiporter [Desulfobacterales bacterium]
MYQNLAILAAFAFLYSAVAGRLEKTPISGAIVAMGIGFASGPLGLGIFTPHVDGELLRTLAELTLALVLFTDAANANLSVLKISLKIPERLLLIGLPLTILLGFGFGFLVFPGMALFELAVLATMLAPTDAALGKAVVTHPSVPATLRESLNVESGLNDGICVPILLVFLTLASDATMGGGGFQLALVLVAQQIGIGAAVGLGLALAGSWVLKRCAQRQWITETWQQLPVVALAFVCFAAAQDLGGSGFIASFTGGLFFGALAKEHKHNLLRAAEGAGDTLSIATWMSFGAAVVGQVIGKFSWPVLIYSLLSLTVVRMLPVYLSLAGSSLKPGSKLFLGWFGPRGLATVVFAVIVLEHHLPGGQELALTAACTVILSILAHGFSANPLAASLGAREGQKQND